MAFTAAMVALTATFAAVTAAFAAARAAWAAALAALAVAAVLNWTPPQAWAQSTPRGAAHEPRRERQAHLVDEARVQGRGVAVLDGRIVDDTDPYNVPDQISVTPQKRKKISMSMGTAVSLSFNNLKTKNTNLNS